MSEWRRLSFDAGPLFGVPNLEFVVRQENAKRPQVLKNHFGWGHLSLACNKANETEGGGTIRERQGI